MKPIDWLHIQLYKDIQSILQELHRNQSRNFNRNLHEPIRCKYPSLMKTFFGLFFDQNQMLAFLGFFRSEAWQIVPLLLDRYSFIGSHFKMIFQEFCQSGMNKSLTFLFIP